MNSISVQLMDEKSAFSKMQSRIRTRFSFVPPRNRHFLNRQLKNWARR